MPKQDKYTLEEAKAYASEIGEQWTPALESALRAQGKIADEVAPLHSVDPVADRYRSWLDAGPSRAVSPESQTVSSLAPDLQFNPRVQYDEMEDPATDLARGLVKNLSLGYYDPYKGEIPSDNPANVAIGGLGSAIGFSAPFSGITGGMRALGMGARIAPTAAGAIHGLVSAQRDEAGNPIQIQDESGELRGMSAGEQAKGRTGAGLQTGAMVGALGVLGQVPGVKQIAEGPGSAPYNMGLMTAIEKLQDKYQGWRSVRQAKKELRKEGIPWSDEVEQQLRDSGAIQGGEMSWGEAWGRGAPFGAGLAIAGAAEQARPARAEADLVRAREIFRQRQERIGSSPNLPSVVEQPLLRGQPSPNADFLTKPYAIPAEPVTPRRGEGATPLLTGSDPIIYAEPRRPAPVPPRDTALVPESSGYPAPRVEVGRRVYRRGESRNTPEVQSDITASAEVNARAGRYQLGRRMSQQEAADEYQRTRTVTTDMLGGQQLYEWLTGKAKKSRQGKAEAAEARAQDLAGEMMEAWRNNPDNASWLWSDGGNPAPAGPAIKPGFFREIEGIPFSRHIADFGNDRISAVEMVNRLVADPSFTEAPAGLRENLAAGKYGNVSAAASVFRDPRRNVQTAGGGGLNNPATKGMIRVGEMTEMVKHKMNQKMQTELAEVLDRAGIKRKSRDANLLYDLMRVTNTGESAADVSAKPKAQAILSRAKNANGLLDAATGIRKSLDAQAYMRNGVNKALGSKAWAPKPGYVPEVETQSRNPLRRLEQATRPNPALAAPSKNPRVFSPREMRRKGTIPDERLEKDMWKLADYYTADTARKVANSAALTSGESVVREYRKASKAAKKSGANDRARELRSTAEALSAMNQYRFGGKLALPGPAGWTFRMAASNRLAAGAVNSALAFKRLFNLAKYTLPVKFIVLRQWTSSGLLEAHSPVAITPAMWGKALANSMSPRVINEYKNSYVGFSKGSRAGKIRAQGMLGDALPSPLLEHGRSVRRGVVSAIDAPVQGMEAWTGQLSFAMAEQIAKKAGVPDKDLPDFKSDVAGMTQSFYDRINRAPILSDPILNLLFPAQSFSVESLNNIYDLVWRGQAGATGVKLSPAKRAERALALVNTMAILNMVYTYVNSYKKREGYEKPWDDILESAYDVVRHIPENAYNTAKNFVPYVPSMLPDSPSNGRTYVGAALDDIDKAIDYIGKGEYQRAYSKLANDFKYGGSTISRYVDAKRMLDDGVITEEYFPWAALMGWWTVPGGMELMQKYKRYKTGDGDMPIPPRGAGAPARPNRPQRPETSRRQPRR